MTATDSQTEIKIPTVTPFVSVVDIERLLAFAKETFGAKELHRTNLGGGRVFCFIGISDSILMFGGGPPVAGGEHLAALHVYVPDADATYRRALDAGGESLEEPKDKPYGERNATVRDSTGNLWFIATRRPGVEPPTAMRAVTPYVIARDALGLIDFLKRAFSARELGVFTSPEGKLMHAALTIGDSVLELGDAEGVPPPALHLFVPDADAAYEQALAAGASSLFAPADRKYGHREAGVKDAWGVTWYIASELR